MIDPPQGVMACINTITNQLRKMDVVKNKIETTKCAIVEAEKVVAVAQE